MPDYTLLQAQQDIASLRGQFAHLLASAEIINLTVDGQIKTVLILDNVASPFNWALADAAGTSPLGDGYAQGYTGPVQQFHAGSSPRTVETWQNVTPPAGWSGTNRYKKLAEFNFICVDIQCTHAGATGNITFMTLPAAYTPTTLHSNIPAIGNNTAPANSNQRIDFNTNGNVTTFSLPANTTLVKGTWIVPLD